jgi:hypothetical protein
MKPSLLLILALTCSAQDIQVCGIKGNPRIFIDTSVNDGSETVSVARWLTTDSAVWMRTAVFTTKRCITQDGDFVDGKQIQRILPGSLAITKDGLVAYEALYVDDSFGSNVRHLHQGVFIQRQFVFEIDIWADQYGPPEFDFKLNDDGSIVPRPGIILSTAPIPYRQ